MKMKIFNNHEIIDRLFKEWHSRLGRDFVAYRNHVYRVFNFSSAIASATGDNLEKLAIASAFHDIGIWLDNTFDYLEPSIQRASAFLIVHSRDSWSAEIGNIIRQHHKISTWRGPEMALVEAFRRADWLDVCLFAIPTRLPISFLAEVLSKFPREGFHGRLMALSFSWVRQHPLRPLPMFRL